MKVYHKRKKMTFRVDSTTHLHLRQLAKAQHMNMNDLLTNLVNGNYHPRKQLSPVDQVRLFDSFIHAEHLVGSINNDISHDSANLNQIAFKVNTHDFKNQNPAYIANNVNELKQVIKHDDITVQSAKFILDNIRKEMLKIWRLLI